MKLLLSPHNDDEALFCSYLLLREKPLVVIVTDGYKHLKRYGITVEQRRQESIAACKILQVPVVFLGLRDDALTADDLTQRLLHWHPDVVYAPAPYIDGNPDHNTVGEVALRLWPDRLVQYATYRGVEPAGGRHTLVMTEAEHALKRAALAQYKSQHGINAVYFQAMLNSPEHLT